MPNTKVRSFWVLCPMPREFWSFLDWLLRHCRHYCLLSTSTRYYYLSPFPQPLKFPHMCALISTLLYTQGRSSAGIWSSLSLSLCSFLLSSTLCCKLWQVWSLGLSASSPQLREPTARCLGYTSLLPSQKLFQGNTLWQSEDSPCLFPVSWESLFIWSCLVS